MSCRYFPGRTVCRVVPRHTISSPTVPARVVCRAVPFVPSRCHRAVCCRAVWFTRAVSCGLFVPYRVVYSCRDSSRTMPFAAVAYCVMLFPCRAVCCRAVWFALVACTHALYMHCVHIHHTCTAHTHMHIHTYTAHICTYTHAHMYIYTYMYIHAHTYMHI